MILLELPVEEWELLLKLADRRWHELDAERRPSKSTWTQEEILAQQRDLEAVMAVLREAGRG